MEALGGKLVPSSVFAAPLVAAPTFASDTSSQSAHTGDLGLGRQSSVTSRLPQLLGAKLGSKRYLDVADEEDDTPTKRAKDLEDGLYARHGPAWLWARSPAGLLAGPSEEVGMQLEPCSLSEFSTSTEADLCCGESFGRASPRAAEPAEDARAPAGACLPLACCGSQEAGHSEDDGVVQEMIRNLYATEEQLRPDPAYMEKHGAAVQPALFIDASMRAIAVSWLVEVACEYGLHQETLFLAIALLDRFLTHSKAVPRSNLQLVSVACMLVASKHEEEVHPSVMDFTNIADNCFAPGDLLKMEGLVLQSLGFHINMPTAHTFLSLLKLGLRLDARAAAAASFITELAALEYAMLRYPPSVLAAAAVLVAGAHAETDAAAAAASLQALCGYAPGALRGCAEELLVVLQRAAGVDDGDHPAMAVKDKYRDGCWLGASRAVPPLRLPERLFAAGA